MSAGRRLRIGTRASRLARWQTRAVAEALEARVGVSCEEVMLSTAGDRDRETPLPEIGGAGLFTEALEKALCQGEIDLAVHSLKDLPTESRGELVLAAIGPREDPRDVLISRRARRLADLPPRASVGTSSLRRAAQLRAFRADLETRPLRGNVDTRVRKALEGEYDAIVMAAAGILRLGLENEIAEFLPFSLMLPAPGQGALAVQCRASDAEVLSLLAALDEPDVRAAVEAERAFLAALDAGCSAPVAAFGEVTNGEASRTLALEGLVAAVDGRRVVRVSTAGEPEEAVAVGERLAAMALETGAGDLLR